MDVRYLTRVPVRMLRYGLYVAEPDRPWNEVPVMFQGFELKSREDLDTLRKHCAYVYVDEERSREDARAEMVQELEDPATEGDAAPGETDISAALGQSRHPDKRRLSKRLRATAAVRSVAESFLARTWRDARLGRAVDTTEARGVVDSLAREVSGNATAALWLTSLKQKDEESTVHSVNVCVLTLAFGMYLGLRGSQLKAVGLGALLHDVGKLSQPDEVLSKPTALTAQELAVVRKHPEEGCRIVAKNQELPQEVFDIIRMHHERVDGAGFPQGLRGDDFPYHARIVGLVNLYDSLTTDRPYRPGRPADEILQELYNERQQTFGATLVQEFINCIGIYPIGSLVELDNGAVGVVVGSSPSSRLRPTVLLAHTPDGRPYQKRLLLNLDAEPVDGQVDARKVRRVVNPALYDIDVTRLVAFEFGIDL